MEKVQSVILTLIVVTLVGAAHAKQRVCVVGAGLAGLASLKLLRDYPQDFEPIAFDKNSDVGGLWIYTDSTDVDGHGLPVHSSVYKYMRTNLPKEVMAYPDYLEFRGPENRSYVSHESVLEYLRNYTDHFDLRQNIKFDTLVEKVIPIVGEKWRVKTLNLNTNASDETICDAVMVCNGAFSKPNIPKIPGIESFPGRIFHSHVYRRPEEFEGKTVAILGASASGTDIGIELTSYAKTVYLSHRHEKLPKNFPENLIQVRGVIAANGSELTLEDGSNITADAFIYCTGYLREFSFLGESSGIFVENKRHVHPLYKYIINVEHPSMAFIGIHHFYVKGTLVYSQAKFFLNVLRDKITLPRYEVMFDDSKTPPPVIGTVNENEIYDSEWDYNADLAKEGGFEPLPSFYEKSMELLLPIYYKFVDFKDYDLKFLDNGDPILVRRQKV